MEPHLQKGRMDLETSRKEGRKEGRTEGRTDKRTDGWNHTFRKAGWT
jgi:hypothetical protein